MQGSLVSVLITHGCFAPLRACPFMVETGRDNAPAALPGDPERTQFMRRFYLCIESGGFPLLHVFLEPVRYKPPARRRAYQSVVTDERHIQHLSWPDVPAHGQVLSVWVALNWDRNAFHDPVLQSIKLRPRHFGSAESCAHSVSIAKSGERLVNFLLVGDEISGSCAGKTDLREAKTNDRIPEALTGTRAQIDISHFLKILTVTRS